MPSSVTVFMKIHSAWGIEGKKIETSSRKVSVDKAAKRTHSNLEKPHELVFSKRRRKRIAKLQVEGRDHTVPGAGGGGWVGQRQRDI